jgi:hypothetical protein
MDNKYLDNQLKSQEWICSSDISLLKDGLSKIQELIISDFQGIPYHEQILKIESFSSICASFCMHLLLLAQLKMLNKTNEKYEPSEQEIKDIEEHREKLKDSQGNV